MARFDVARAALRLTEEELGVAALLLADPDDPELRTPEANAILRELEDAGVTRDGALVEYAGRLLALVVAPRLRISVEKFVAHESTLDQAYATEEQAVLGSQTGDREIEFAPVSPALLPWAIASGVALGPRAHDETEPLAVPAESLAGADAALDVDDEAAAEAALEPLAEADRARMLAVLRNRRMSWRATSAWKRPDGEVRVRSVAVLDGASSGLWLTRHEDGVAHLQPVPPSVVWERIVDLVPDGGDD
jgi:hypothetical protein